MVECMEAWFLADKEYLEKFFGAKFSRNVLPGRRDVEKVPKKDVLAGIEKATRHCGKPYHKGRHSFDLLAQVDPEKVATASPHVRRLLDCLASAANSTRN